MIGSARGILRAKVRNFLSAVTHQKADYWMLDMAIKLVDHNTTTARTRFPPGTPGSLLGDYLEFGCACGASFIHAYRRAAHRMPWMRFWALDSFAGLPRPADIDQDGEAREGLFACSQQTFFQNLDAAKVDRSRIVCVPGWYRDTLTSALKENMGLKVASIVYIDCDLYQSAAEALEFITDLVETGSVLIFDEWWTFKGDPNHGEQRACAEWLARNPEIALQDWHFFGAYGKSFIVTRPNR
jgi:hypothetical protein